MMMQGKGSARSVEASPALRQLIDDDAVGQLRRREGLMATLGSEDGVPKLDWVEGTARLLEDETLLEEVEAEARAIRERGIRHIIWAGMGGSVMAVRVLVGLGFCSQVQNEGEEPQGVVIHPLDSTDPATLNEVVRKIALAKGFAIPVEPTSTTTTFLHTLLQDVLMVGVSMGMTSEEPITHLTWFIELLAQAQLQPEEHLLVMTLPGSYLDAFANEHHVPSRPLQLDGGTGTGGRMSAPTTRVFLLPAALALTDLSNEPGGEGSVCRSVEVSPRDRVADIALRSGELRKVLYRAWQEYKLTLASEQPAEHTFVQLAAALSDASRDGACRLLLSMPEGWQAVVPWIEQLLEESLGKGGKGVVVFDDAPLHQQASCYHTEGTLRVHVVTDTVQQEEDDVWVLYQPALSSQKPKDRLAAVTSTFLGWQLSMALYGYLHRITFAGQPAVENYKARARMLRNAEDPLQVVQQWKASATEGTITLLVPPTVDIHGTPALMFARMVQEAALTQGEQGQLGYLDLTINGELSTSCLSVIDAHLHTIGNELLGVPVKLRRAPAAYHATEQSEMDGGPSYLVSLRVLMYPRETSIFSTYNDTFLRAQAMSTWQAMIEQGRSCSLLLIKGSAPEAEEKLQHFLHEVEEHLKRTFRPYRKTDP